MQALVIATKAPWPPIDGGRLLLWHTLAGLASLGERATLVAPVDPGRFDLGQVAEALEEVCTAHLVAAPPARAAATCRRAVTRNLPWTIARHARAEVRREVAALLAARRFDVVHAEQLQALPQAAPALAGGVPVLLRAQNVESDLWSAAGRLGGPAAGWLLRAEARRLAAWEGAAVRRAALTLALSRRDAARLAALAGGESAPRVRFLAAPCPALLEPGTPPLPGEPPVVLLEGAGWLPNREGARWFCEEVWPRLLPETPGAVLHLFAQAAPGAVRGLVLHPPPGDSAAAFPPGVVLAVPLRVASGVRMKVLEAWARGAPVVGTPEALAGLEVRDGVEALLAADAEGFAAAIGRLAREPGLGRALAAGGRAALAARHDPGRLARELLEVYASLA